MKNPFRETGKGLECLRSNLVLPPYPPVAGRCPLQQQHPAPLFDESRRVPSGLSDPLNLTSTPLPVIEIAGLADDSLGAKTIRRPAAPVNALLRTARGGRHAISAVPGTAPDR